jgi:hypothetical protein
LVFPRVLRETFRSLKWKVPETSRVGSVVPCPLGLAWKTPLMTARTSGVNCSLLNQVLARLSSETKIKVESKSFGKRLIIMNANFVDKGGKAWVMSTTKRPNFFFRRGDQRSRTAMWRLDSDLTSGRASSACMLWPTASGPYRPQPRLRLSFKPTSATVLSLKQLELLAARSRTALWGLFPMGRFPELR